MLVPVNFSTIILSITGCILFIFGNISSPTTPQDLSSATGAARFPPLTPANGNLDPVTLIQYNYLVNVTKKVNADGSLQGPFNELL